jgi:hypothetical protein
MTVVMGCIKCSTRSPDMRGALCAACASKLSCADYHVPGIVRSTIAPRRAQAWLIDPWGQPHAIASGTTIGRAPTNDVVISDRHVSSDHADIKLVDDTWRIHDRGSSAGTQVRALRNVRSERVAHLDELQIASLGFYLWARAEAPAPGALPVVETFVERKPDFRISGPDGTVLDLRGRTAGDSGKEDGVLIVRASGVTSQRPLSPLQYQLFATLCTRAIRDPRADGGYVDTRELLSALPFTTARPQEVNVRQVVRGLRKVLESAGVGIDPRTKQTTLIDAVVRVGYRLTWRAEYVAEAERH